MKITLLENRVIRIALLKLVNTDYGNERESVIASMIKKLEKTISYRSR